MSAPVGAFAGGGTMGREGDAPRAGSAALSASDDTFAFPDFTDRERAILAYADRVTLEPAAVTEGDIRRLRDAGLEDRAIHDACAIVAYFAFVNRMADGLGVELEEDHREWKDGPTG